MLTSLCDAVGRQIEIGYTNQIPAKYGAVV